MFHILKAGWKKNVWKKRKMKNQMKKNGYAATNNLLQTHYCIGLQQCFAHLISRGMLTARY